MGIFRVVCHAVLVQVGNVNDGLDAQQTAVLQDILVSFGKFKAGGVLAFTQVVKQCLTHFHFPLGFLVAALGVLGGLVQPALHHFHICQDQLQRKGLSIPDSIGRLRENVVIFKAANHVHQGIHQTDVLQHGVAPAAALLDAHDIHKVNGGGGGLSGVIVLRQPVQTGVGHLGVAHVGLRGGVGEHAGLHLGAGQRIEQSGLAHVGKADDT